MAWLDPVERSIRRLPAIVTDASIAGGLVLLGAIELGPGFTSHPGEIGLLVLGAIGVTLRRRNVWLGFWIVQLATVIGLVLAIPVGETHAGQLEIYIVLYTVASRRTLKGSAVALVTVLLADFAGVLYLLATRQLLPPDIHVTPWIFLFLVLNEFVWIAFVWFAGRAQHRRHDIASVLELEAADLRSERERLAAAAVASERKRIAGDLHGVVVQAIREMNALIRSARLQLGTDEAQARASVIESETIGRDALVQMRRLILVLREDHELGPAIIPSPWTGAPQSTTAALDSGDRQ